MRRLLAAVLVRYRMDRWSFPIARSSLRSRDAEPSETAMDRAPIDAEGPGRLREVPVHVVQHPNHVPIRNFGYRRPPWRRSSSFAMAYCREHVDASTCPRSVDFVDELPRLPTGKLLKRELRARYRSA